MEVSVENFEVDCAKVSLILEVIAKQYKVESFYVTLSFVSQEEIQELNQDYRQKPSSTDVLSFPQINWQEALTLEKVKTGQIEDFFMNETDFISPAKVLGDIVISLDDAEQNAKNIGQSLDRELCFLIVHGFLHLLGHDHIEQEDEVLMRTEQNLLMEILQSSNTPLWNNCVHRLVGSC